MLEVRKGDLFQGAPDTALLVHACNSRGIWGRGVATEFKKRFPKAYKDYANWCSEENRLGKSLITGRVGCLVTSRNYGCYCDPPHLITQNTQKAINDLLSKNDHFTEIHSPMINAGLFRVPWTITEKIIKVSIFNRPIKWVVWKL
jgi:ADP-ribose 1''-phosphate phosphatase